MRRIILTSFMPDNYSAFFHHCQFHGKKKNYNMIGLTKTNKMSYKNRDHGCREICLQKLQLVILATSIIKSA